MVRNKWINICQRDSRKRFGDTETLLKIDFKCFSYLPIEIAKKVQRIQGGKRVRGGYKGLLWVGTGKQVVTESYKGLEEVKRGLQGYRRIQGGYMVLQGAAVGYKGLKELQGVRRDYRGLQEFEGITGGCKGLQLVTRDFMGLQEGTRGFKRLQEVTRGYKW